MVLHGMHVADRLVSRRELVDWGDRFASQVGHSPCHLFGMMLVWELELERQGYGWSASNCLEM